MVQFLTVNEVNCPDILPPFQSIAVSLGSEFQIRTDFTLNSSRLKADRYGRLVCTTLTDFYTEVRPTPQNTIFI